MFILGNDELAEIGASTMKAKQSEIIAEWKSAGYSIVYLSRKRVCKHSDMDDVELLGMWAIGQELRENASAVIRHLQHDMNIRCYIASGDSKETVWSISHSLGIPQSMTYSGQCFLRARLHSSDSFSRRASRGLPR
jgi:cation transport ATPase